MYWVVTTLVEVYNLYDSLSIDDVVLRALVMEVEAGYSAVLPYHSALHAADVTQAMSYYIAQVLHELDIVESGGDRGHRTRRLLLLQ